MPLELADVNKLSPRDACESLEAPDLRLIVIQTKFNQISK